MNFATPRFDLQVGVIRASKEVVKITFQLASLAISVCSLMVAAIMMVLKIIEVARSK